MPLKKLSKEDLSADTEYVQFLRSLKPGEGGRTTTDAEGVGKVSIKKRLQKASAAAGVTIDFVRTDPDTVVFERTKG